MNKLTDSILKYRLAVMIAIISMTLFFLYQIKDIRINSDFINSLPDDDPIALEYKALSKKYRGTDMSMIILQAPDIYTPNVIADIKSITDTLRIIPGITTVTSLTNIIYIESDSLGIEVGRLIDDYDLPETPADIEFLKERISRKDMYKGSIVSEDGTATIIMFTLDGESDHQDVIKDVKSRIESMQLPHDILFGGMPVLLHDISDLILMDIRWLIPLVAIILLVILFLSFRSVRGTILPIISVAISSIWTVGVMALLNYDITLVSGNIPVVLFAVGSAYAIHVINHARAVQGRSFPEVLKSSLRYLILPVFLSSLTTVLGFVAFVFGSYLTMIKDFGIFSALGTFFSFVMAITLVPVILSWFPPKSAGNEQKAAAPGILERFALIPLKNLLFKHPRIILAFWIILLVAGFASSFTLIRNTNIAAYFKPGNATRVSENILQEKFGGSSPIYIRFAADMQDPEVLQQMRNTEEFIRKSPWVSVSTSVAGLVEELNDAMGEGRQIPEDRARIEQLWFLLDGQEVMDQLVADDLQEGIIQSRFASISSTETDIFLGELRDYTASIETDNMKISVNGMPAVYQQMDRSLVNSQMSSIAIAVVFVLILVAISLQSLRLGIFGIIPLIATIVMLFGFMGITGIPIDLATVLVASVALGIGIDYSIHVISAWNHYLNQTGNLGDAMEKTIMITGKSIFINIVAVASGFSVLLFSQIVPMQFFGLLVAISMFSSGIGSLTLLPVILIIDHKRRLKP